MDVFHLQGMTTPVMVSGAAVCGGLRVGAVSVDHSAGEPAGQETGFLGRFVRTSQLQGRKYISS